ncbi:hypothetical protein EIP91_010977 [Steccherinum ochraceum]|uniref:DUF7918 domain-containing protein n=1 Tax=Steccherinum ochraceum TaxID=92696 RepID=A0A4R0RS81_9APHY|nr:hypothetical protein EIP91_010977 [Steccherinum ochraceum]
MPGILGLSAQILVDGEKLEEYGEEVVNGNTVSCYVASQVDQNFVIQIENTSQDLVTFRTWIDGKDVQGLLCSRGDTDVVEGVDVTPTTMRPFHFGALRLTDDDTVRDLVAGKDVGCIELRVLRARPGTSKPATFRDHSSHISDEAVHERSKKSGSHRVALGTTQNQPAVERVRTQKLDPSDRPYARIRFLYRPHDLLQAQGIIPAAQSSSDLSLNSSRKRKADEPHLPVPPPARAISTSQSSRESSVKVEVKEEARRPRSAAKAAKMDLLRELKATMERVQAEIDEESSDDEGLPIKREASPIRVPQRKSGKRVLIDLTVD